MPQSMYSILVVRWSSCTETGNILSKVVWKPGFNAGMVSVWKKKPTKCIQGGEWIAGICFHWQRKRSSYHWWPLNSDVVPGPVFLVGYQELSHHQEWSQKVNKPPTVAEHWTFRHMSVPVSTIPPMPFPGILIWLLPQSELEIFLLSMSIK